MKLWFVQIDAGKLLYSDFNNRLFSDNFDIYTRFLLLIYLCARVVLVLMSELIEPKSVLWEFFICNFLVGFTKFLLIKSLLYFEISDFT